MIEDIAQKKKYGLHFTQKWSIAAAILSIMHQVVTACFWIHYAPFYPLVKIFSTMGSLLAIVKIAACILVLTPSCMKNPTSARKWSLVTIPLFMVHIGQILFIAYFCLILIIRGGGIWLNYDNVFWTLSVIFVCGFVNDVSLIVALMKCSLYLQKCRQLKESRSFSSLEKIMLM